MKKILLSVLFSTFGYLVHAQQLVLKKGEILDSIPVVDSIQRSYSLYLPTQFSMDVEWPLLLVLDMNGKQRQALSMFARAAESQGYVLMSPQTSDSLPVTDNMVHIGDALERVGALLPIDGDRIYVAGEAASGRFASLVPVFVHRIQGVISIGSALANVEVLDKERRFHFIGIVNKENFNYPILLNETKLLDRLKYPNQILLHDGSGSWPPGGYLDKALQIFTLASMAKNGVPKDSTFIERAYGEDLDKVEQLKGVGDVLWAHQYMGEMVKIYRPNRNMDSLNRAWRDLGGDKRFKAMERAENTALVKEALLREEYLYAMEDDVLAHNFENLGWWNYQMQQFQKYISGADPFERQMGHRLKGFVNALALDHIHLVKGEAEVDQDALAFLYMVKTILEPDNFDYYLRTVSLAAENEDYGTALYYLEEAFKRGFKDRDRLYALENTALLRVSPAFNELVAQYLGSALYGFQGN